MVIVVVGGPGGGLSVGLLRRRPEAGLLLPTSGFLGGMATETVLESDDVFWGVQTGVGFLVVVAVLLGVGEADPELLVEGLTEETLLVAGEVLLGEERVGVGEVGVVEAAR